MSTPIHHAIREGNLAILHNYHPPHHDKLYLIRVDQIDTAAGPKFRVVGSYGKASKTHLTDDPKETYGSLYEALQAKPAGCKVGLRL